PAATVVRSRATDKTLVLDLDETLIHARTDVRKMGEGRFDFMDQRPPRRVFVRKRPHLREFLEAASELFEVVLFTAATEEFANAVVEHVDPERKLVDHILSRESC
ncbi:unnamed protein product, partial [Hapterophycus canaliculatus]